MLFFDGACLGIPSSFAAGSADAQQVLRLAMSPRGYGLGVGPAAALMTTLPAVSLPSLAMVAKGFSLRVVVVVAATVVGLGLLSAAVALLLNF